MKHRELSGFLQTDRTDKVAYEKYLTIENPQEVILSDVPVQAGQRVKVVIMIEDDVDSVLI